MNQKDDVVVYSNELNKARFSGFTATDMDLFMSLCVLAKDQDTRMIEIDFCELRRLANFRNCTTEEFQQQFVGLKGTEIAYSKTGKSAENEIDAISGATITTKAITNAINAGLGFLEENGCLQ